MRTFLRASSLVGVAALAETIDHFKMLVGNGPEKCRAFGRYLGQWYKRFPSLLWMSGNDFQTWREPKNDEAALAVAKAIGETGPDHLQTVELNYEVSGSLDDPNWEPLMTPGSYAYVLKTTALKQGAQL